MRALREERALGLACGIGRLAGRAKPLSHPPGQGTEPPMGTGDGDDPDPRQIGGGVVGVDPRS